MPAEPKLERVSALAMMIQPNALAGPTGSAIRITTIMVTANTINKPAQKQAQGVCSTRRRARSTGVGNNSHNAVSMPGKAMPKVRRMPKMAVISAMGKSFLFRWYICDTGVDGEKLQEPLNTKGTKVTKV